MTDSNTTQKPRVSRTDVLRVLYNLIERSTKKTVNGRVRDPKNEVIRQNWARVAIAGITVYLAGLRDMEMEAIERRLAALEETKQS